MVVAGGSVQNPFRGGSFGQIMIYTFTWLEKWMNVHKNIVLFLLCTVFVTYGAETITGSVVNGSSTGLASAKVWLKSNPSVVDSTDAEGKFALPIVTTAIGSKRQASVGTSFLVAHNRLLFSLTAPQRVDAKIFRVSGEKVATLFTGVLAAGEHAYAIDKLMRAASGTYVLALTSSEHTAEFLMLCNNGVFSLHQQLSKVGQVDKAPATQAAAFDTLIVLRMGYAIKKVALSDISAQDMGTLSLSPRTYSVAATTAVNAGRTIEVILPSDYDQLYSLPVLYLLHGGGEDHTAWRIKGQLITIMNSFDNKDKMQPMIIVTPDASSTTGYGDYGKKSDAFYTDLTVGIRAYVESHYKADTSRVSRAISGFSMGAMQTHNFTLFYPDLFGYAYPICGGLYKSAGFSEATMKADIASGAIDSAAVHTMKAYKLHSNETDIAWTDTRDFEKYLGSCGIKHTFDFTSYSIGGHTFSYCNAVFQQYAVEIFKQ